MERKCCATCIYAVNAWFDDNAVFCIPDKIHGKGRFILDKWKTACLKYKEKMKSNNNEC